MKIFPLKIRCFVLLLVCLLALPAAAQEQTPYEIALQRIEEARVSGATELDLSVLGLTELPPELWQLKHLQVLNIADNQLSILPPEIGQFANLQMLESSYNQLSELPPEIGQLANLQTLNLGNNQLTLLPSEIGQLTNLQWLRLEENQLSELPPEIRRLTNLQYLWLYNNQLTELPLEIGQLEQLCQLDLRNNHLRALPTEIGNLPHLAEVGRGCSVNLDGNPLITPPPEVIAQGTPAVLAYLREQAWYHTRQLLLSAAGGVGILAGVLLLARRRYRRLRKPKAKRREIDTSG